MDIFEFVNKVKQETNEEIPKNKEIFLPETVQQETTQQETIQQETEQQEEFEEFEFRINERDLGEVQGIFKSKFPSINPTRIIVPNTYKKTSWISVGIELTALNDPSDKYSPRTKVTAEASVHIPGFNSSPEEIKTAILNLGEEVHKAALVNLKKATGQYNNERGDIIMIAKISLWEKLNDVIDTLTADNPTHVFMILKKKLYVFFKGGLELKIRKSLLEEYSWKSDIKKTIKFGVSAEAGISSIKETDTFFIITFELGTIRNVVEEALAELVNTAEINKEVELELKKKNKSKRSNKKKTMDAYVEQVPEKQEKKTTEEKAKKEKVKQEKKTTEEKAKQEKKIVEEKEKQEKKSNAFENWVTIEEAANILGISKRTVYRKIKSGSLEMKEEGKKKLVKIKR